MPLLYKLLPQQAINKSNKFSTHFDSTVFLYSVPARKEVTVIRSMAPINLIVYHPKTEEGQMELAKRVSDVHAAAVTQRIKSLHCPTRQKLELVDAVIETVKKRSREQTR